MPSFHLHPALFSFAAVLELYRFNWLIFVFRELIWAQNILFSRFSHYITAVSAQCKQDDRKQQPEKKEHEM